MMKLNHSLAFLVLLSLFGCATSAQLEESKTVMVQGDLTPQSVGAIVEEAVKSTAYWRIVKKPTANSIYAQVLYRGLAENVVLSWDENKVTFVPSPDKDKDVMPISRDARRFRNLRDSLLGNIRNGLHSEGKRVSDLHIEPSRTMDLSVLVIGDAVVAAKTKLASYGQPLEEGAVKTPEGLAIGYYLVTYDGHPKNIGSSYVTLIFYNRSYVAYMLQDKADSELLVFDDYTHKLWEAKKITFRNYIEWKKRKWFAVRNVAPDTYDEELYFYQLWQAERVDSRQSTLTEFRFVVKEKNRQIAEARANEQRAEERAAVEKSTASYQAQMLSLQRRSLEEQRRANITMEFLTAFSATYRPNLPRSINCTSYKSFSGYSTTTSCY